MIDHDRAAGSRGKSGVGPKKQQQEPWTEEIGINQCTMALAYLLRGAIGIGYLAMTWSTVVLLGGFVTVLGKKDFWCLTFISMMQAAGIFTDWEERVMDDFVRQVLLSGMGRNGWLENYLRRNGPFRWMENHLRRIIPLRWPILPFYPIIWLLWIAGFLVFLVVGTIYQAGVIICVGIYIVGDYICGGISLWRVIQRDYGNMDDTKANLMPALDLFYSLILCQGKLFFLRRIIQCVEARFAKSLHGVCEFPEMWGRKSFEEYRADTRSKCWRDPKSIKDRRLVKYAVDLLDSQSSQDYLSGARMLDVFIEVHQMDVRPLILPSSQKVQKLLDTLKWSSRSDIEIKELAARILAHLACDIDLTQFPGAMRCISALLGTTTHQPYWNNHQHGSSNKGSNESPQSNKLDQPGAGDSQGDKKRIKSKWGQISSKIQKSKLGQLYAKMEKTKFGQLFRKGIKSNLDHQGAGDSQGGRWNELILQGLTILERLASDQHNCRDICSTPDLITKIMSPIYLDTLIQDINIMEWQDVVNATFRVVHRLICAPEVEWTGRRLAREISCSKQAVSNLERILDQGNTARPQLQMRAMEILTELALDPSANLAMETKENLINKQVHIFLDEGKEEDLRITAGKTLLALLSKKGTISVVCIMSEYNHIVDQVTEILDAKSKVIYRTIAAEILENLCTLHTMDKNHVKNTLLPKVLTEVLTSKKKPPSEALEWHVSKASGDIEENPLQDEEENQRLEHNGQINPSEQNEMQTAMMELKEALLSLTSVIFDKLIISGEDFDDVAGKVAPGEGEFVAKLKTIVEENCEATANSLRIVKLCGQIAVTMMRRSQYNAHFKEQNFVETLSKASRIMCNLESCMLFAGTDGSAKKTARPLLSDLVEEAAALVA